MIESHPEVERCYMKKIPESIGHWDNFENLMKIRKVNNEDFMRFFVCSKSDQRTHSLGTE